MLESSFPRSRSCSRKAVPVTRSPSRLVALAATFFLIALPASATIPQGDVAVALETVATGLVSPVSVTHAGDGSGRLFIVDQAGTIRIVKDGNLLPTPFLDVSDLLPALNTFFDERGLLGLAFHPDYANNGRFFIRYSAPREGGSTEPCFGTSRGCHREVLAEYSVSPGDPDVADPASARILFMVDEPQFNHNSGEVAFGPDGYLYFTLGDGGGANDGLADDPPSHGPNGNGQNIETVLGSMLRIDVDGPPQAPLEYAIPADNPFVGVPGRDEIYAYGMRNPFKFSFDDGPGGTGALYLADVGQGLFEEVNLVVKGGNYGWVIREGFHCFDPFNPFSPPAVCPTTGPLGEPLIDPIVEYAHPGSGFSPEGGITVIGGFVYRGSRSPSLTGTYVFGDFAQAFVPPSGSLYYLVEPAPGSYEIREFRIVTGGGDYGLYLKGFGEDEDGEIYACGSTALGPQGASGVVQRIVAVRDVAVDVRPAGCPNPLNPAARGVVPVAILGSADFDVRDIDPSSVRLEGVAAKGTAFEDVAAPSGASGPCDCTEAGPDGLEDLTLKFMNAALAEALGPVSPGEERVLTLSGELTDGTPIEGRDCVVVVGGNGGPGPDPGSSGDEPAALLIRHDASDPASAIQRIQYRLPRPALVSLAVYDVTGRLVDRLVQDAKPAGIHAADWNTVRVPDGIYFYRLRVGDVVDTHKTLVVR